MSSDLAAVTYKITNYETVHRDIDIINGWRPDLVRNANARRNETMGRMGQVC